MRHIQNRENLRVIASYNTSPPPCSRPAGHTNRMPAKKPSPPSRAIAAPLEVGTRLPAARRTRPSKTLDAFPNPNPERDYLIHMRVPEFTCLCPLTGQPDFAEFKIEYIPDRLCIELKSLKLYMWSFRDEGAFHEAMSNRVLDDLVGAARPRFMRVTARWAVRGGIFTDVVAEYRKKGWKPDTRIELPPEMGSANADTSLR